MKTTSTAMDERTLVLTLLIGMAFCAITCVIVAVPPLWRLVQAYRAREATWDAEVFDEPTPIYDQLAAERDDFAQWSAEMGADR